jgi:hypothetical protein
MRFAILFALTVFVAVLSPCSALAADADRERFSASFRYVGSRNEEATRRDAIDRGVDGFFFAIRGIARSRLSDGTKIDPWVNFSFDADNLRVRVPSTTTVSPANGTFVDHGSGGDRSKLSQRLTDGKITQMFVAGEGQRVNEWMLSPDANRLLLKVTVSSPKLTRPVVYTLTYERAR